MRAMVESIGHTVAIHTIGKIEGKTVQNVR